MLKGGSLQARLFFQCLLAGGNVMRPRQQSIYLIAQIGTSARRVVTGNLLEDPQCTKAAGGFMLFETQFSVVQREKQKFFQQAVHFERSEIRGHLPDGGRSINRDASGEFTDGSVRPLNVAYSIESVRSTAGGSIEESLSDILTSGQAMDALEIEELPATGGVAIVIRNAGSGKRRSSLKDDGKPRPFVEGDRFGR